MVGIRITPMRGPGVRKSGQRSMAIVRPGKLVRKPAALVVSVSGLAWSLANRRFG